MRQLVKAFDNGVLTKREDFRFPKKNNPVYSDEKPEERDPVLYPEEEENKTYPFTDLPIIFHRIWRSVNINKLKELKLNDTWMNLTVWLCDKCFYKYAETEKPFQPNNRIKSDLENDEGSNDKLRNTLNGLQPAPIY